MSTVGKTEQILSRILSRAGLKDTSVFRTTVTNSKFGIWQPRNVTHGVNFIHPALAG
jgi:hypothetical protein